MVYLTGYTSNSYHLTHIIHAALKDAGWDIVSGMSVDGIDSVFYSAGEDGNQDIYIRVAAGLADRQTHGEVQFPSSDGYTSYVNFFAYQHFPTDGADASEGTGEVGRYGPLMHMIDSSKNWEEYNWFKSSGEEPRCSDVPLSRDQSYTGTGVYNLSDGHRFYYDSLGGYVYLMRYDYGDYPCYWTTINTDQFNQRSDYLASCYSRKSATEPLLWVMTTGSNYSTWNTYNTMSSSTVLWPNGPSYYARPPWGDSSSSYNWAFQGTRRTGKKYIYINQGAQTSAWARYDIDANEWTYISPGLPFSTYYGSHAILISKEATGYDYDRVYIIRGWGYKYFRSLALDDDGDPVGGWVTHADTLVTQDSGDRLCYPGGDRILFINGGSDVDQWVFPAVPTDSGSWSNAPYPFEHSLGNPISLWVTDHLGSRVAVDEFESTEYWIFADKDRIIVLTSPERSRVWNKQDMAYAGLFESFKNTTPTALISSVTVGEDTLTVDDVSVFKIGRTYKIVELSQGTNITIANGDVVRVGAAEIITIQSVKQSTSQIVLTSGLLNSYSSGAKIAEDVQPVGVTMESLDRIHTVNVAYALDNNIGKDRPWQYCYLQQSVASLNTTSGRTGGRLLAPILLRHDAIYDLDDSAQITKSDIRGKLIGVYFSSSPALGDILERNGQQYRRFSINSKKLGSIMIGPME